MVSYCIFKSKFKRFDEDIGKFFRIRENLGEQKVCNQVGTIVKPMDPNLTGKYDFNYRLQIMQKKYPNENNHIDIPKSLNSDEKRNYSP